ncbi:hypothetical protein N9D31_01335 [Oligoflexaceae bacterium]|nr:hypothetical protein [Oligoflexaceae bacterium]
MPIDLQDAKYRHDLKSAVRTFELFLEWAKAKSSDDSSAAAIVEQVEAAKLFLKSHVEHLYE